MTVIEPDRRWIELGRRACRALRPHFAAVEHIGSTAVPGLPAKPEIDLMAAAEQLDEVSEATLRTFGYRLQGEAPDERLLFRREDYDSTIYSLHVVTARSWPTRDERLLRDLLLADREARDNYAELKLRWVDRLDPGVAYARAKREHLNQLTETARAAQDVPPGPIRGD